MRNDIFAFLESTSTWWNRVRVLCYEICEGYYTEPYSYNLWEGNMCVELVFRFMFLYWSSHYNLLIIYGPLYMQSFGKDSYSRDDIDIVRNEWALHLGSLIMWFGYNLLRNLIVIFELHIYHLTYFWSWTTLVLIS